MRTLLLLRNTMLAGSLFLAGCKSNPPADVAAQVNGRSVTYKDIDRQLELQSAGSQEQPVGD